MIWTVVCTVVVYFVAGTWAAIAFRKNKWAPCVIIVFLLLGLLTGFAVGGSIGAVLGALYQAAAIPMNSHLALIWGVLLALLVVVSALSKSTALL